MRYVPVLNIGGYIPDFPLDTPPDEFQMMFGTRCFFGWTAAPDGSAGWFANPPHPREPAPGELEAMTDADWRTWLLELLGDDYGPMREMIAAAPGPLTGWATYDMPRVRRWYRDNMIIIGDAAHATSPAAGQGAAMALEDAVVLAQCLRDVPDHGVPDVRRAPPRAGGAGGEGGRAVEQRQGGRAGRPGGPRRAAADHLPAGGEVRWTRR